MGEAKRKLSATKKFLMEFPTCCFGGEKRAATTCQYCRCLVQIFDKPQDLATACFLLWSERRGLLRSRDCHSSHNHCRR
jgi:hypothetical protein